MFGSFDVNNQEQSALSSFQLELDAYESRKINAKSNNANENFPLWKSRGLSNGLIYELG